MLKGQYSDGAKALEMSDKSQRLRDRAKALEAEALKLEIRSVDNFNNGSVISFTKKFDGIEYIYVAIKANNYWYMAGNKTYRYGDAWDVNNIYRNWDDWDSLMEFAYGHGNEPKFHYVGDGFHSDGR